MIADKKQYIITNTIMYKEYLESHPDAGNNAKEEIINKFVEGLDNNPEEIQRFFIVSDSDMDYINENKFNITFDIKSDDNETMTMIVDHILTIDDSLEG